MRNRKNGPHNREDVNDGDGLIHESGAIDRDGASVNVKTRGGDVNVASATKIDVGEKDREEREIAATFAELVSVTSDLRNGSEEIMALCMTLI